MSKKEIIAVVLLFLGIGTVFEIPILIAGGDSEISIGSKLFYVLIGLLVFGLTCFISAILLLKKPKN